MASIDVSDLQAVEFPADTVVTAPDTNTYTAVANARYAIPFGQTTMTMASGVEVKCMLARKNAAFDTRNWLQAFVVDEVRTSA